MGAHTCGALFLFLFFCLAVVLYVLRLHARTRPRTLAELQTRHKRRQRRSDVCGCALERGRDPKIQIIEYPQEVSLVHVSIRAVRSTPLWCLSSSDRVLIVRRGIDLSGLLPADSWELHLHAILQGRMCRKDEMRKTGIKRGWQIVIVISDGWRIVMMDERGWGAN